MLASYVQERSQKGEELAVMSSLVVMQAHVPSHMRKRLVVQ